MNIEITCCNQLRGQALPPQPLPDRGHTEGIYHRFSRYSEPFTCCTLCVMDLIFNGYNFVLPFKTEISYSQKYSDPLDP